MTIEAVFDNLSIKELVATITLLCGVFIFLVVYVLAGIPLMKENAWMLVATILVLIVLLYFFIKFILEHFIFDKLRVIYKFINKSKAKQLSVKKDGKQVLNIDDVNTDVLKWAADTEQRIESLKELAEYRKNFVGNVSHELKTPIFSLQGYLHTLLDGGIYDENINIKYLQKAAENADRLQHIVEDLESIGLIESGRMELEREVFDIKELIREVFIDQKRHAKESGIILKFSSNGDQGLNVNADKEAIRQVLNNLITNSIKYGEKDGATTVSCTKVENVVLVEVSDDGIGIEEKHLEYLFDRFYRVDKSRSRSKGGSGLGLSIVKHLIEAHDQSITVNSTVGQGSTFGFTLDLAG